MIGVDVNGNYAQCGNSGSSVSPVQENGYACPGKMEKNIDSTYKYFKITLNHLKCRGFFENK